jgi:EamA domain-containing membrane protein RarD
VTTDPSAHTAATHITGDDRGPGEAAGLSYGTAADTIWGLFPALFGLLSFAGPLQILAHRVAWTPR